MDDDLLSRIKAVDPLVLTDVVRKAQHSPHFEITGWAVDRLSDQGVINPDGLWLYRGQGYDDQGSRSWSVVLKIISSQEQEPPLSDMWHWQREALFARSDLSQSLPGPVKAPLYYRADDTPEGAWLWLEHIENHTSGPWRLDDYAFASQQIGLWNAAFATSARPPDAPWLARQHYLSWTAGIDPQKDLQFSLNQKHITGQLRDRYERLWADREILFSALEALPQTFTHMDGQRRNLMIRKSPEGQNELVMIDWAMCGYAPLGAELYSLVGMSAILFEWPPAALAELDAAAFPAYLQGLVEGGWSGSADAVRLAYSAYLAVCVGIVCPHAFMRWCSAEAQSSAQQQFHSDGEELLLKWLPVFSYSLDRADEARKLIKKLGMFNPA